MRGEFPILLLIRLVVRVVSYAGVDENDMVLALWLQAMKRKTTTTTTMMTKPRIPCG